MRFIEEQCDIGLGGLRNQITAAPLKYKHAVQAYQLMRILQ